MKPAHEIVDDQIKAYVRGDSASFAAHYEVDAVCSFLPSNRVYAAGREEIERKWGEMFSKGSIDFELVGRMQFGRFVMDLEHVRINSGEIIKAMVIYLVGPERIRQVWFLEEGG